MAIALVVIRHLEGHRPVLHRLITTKNPDSPQEREKLTLASALEIADFKEKFVEFSNARFYEDLVTMEDVTEELVQLAADALKK